MKKIQYLFIIGALCAANICSLSAAQRTITETETEAAARKERYARARDKTLQVLNKLPEPSLETLRAVYGCASIGIIAEVHTVPAGQSQPVDPLMENIRSVPADVVDGYRVQLQDSAQHLQTLATLVLEAEILEAQDQDQNQYLNQAIAFALGGMISNYPIMQEPALRLLIALVSKEQKQAYEAAKAAANQGTESKYIQVQKTALELLLALPPDRL